MNQYQEMMERQQKEFNALPIFFAFNDAQFREGMRKLGLNPDTDTDKLYKLPIGEGYYRREDSQLIRDWIDKTDREKADLIAADQTGDGFIKDMFRVELDDHEYCITYDLSDAIYAAGFSIDEINADPRLIHGLMTAAQESRKWYKENCQ